MPAGGHDDMWIGAKHDPALALPQDPNNEEYRRASIQELPPVIDGKPTLYNDLFPSDDDDSTLPTQEEISTLPRVSDKIPWRVYTVAFVELCERFSYYGTQILFQNFVQRPLMTPTGAAPDPNGDVNNNPGALDMGQQAATGLGTFFSFWCYVTPLIGAYVADTYWGRYNTIMISIGCAVVGHVILTAGAAPSVLANEKGAIAAYIIAIVVFGLGTGGFKPNISPLIAEQIVGEKLRVETKEDGKKVIIDPAATAARIYNWFYLFINIGAFIGQITMAYAALYVGYWLAFLLPTIMFLLCPTVLALNKKHYRLRKPQGSVLDKAFKLLFFGMRGKWSINPVTTIKNWRRKEFWDDCKPSKVPADRRPSWMTFDDAWVDEVARGFKACVIFAWFPLYWITYNQMNNNVISQADTMQHAGVPPEIVAQLDPIALIIFIPICDLFVYPALRKAGIRFTPIKRITLGFIFGALSMVWAAVLQHYIYTKNPCGEYPSEGLPSGDNCPPASFTVWSQTGVYVLLAFSEIFASITSLEYAFTKAPKNMRSLVQAVALFTSAVANAIGEALVPLSSDPLLVWNYGAFAVIAFCAGILFWISHKDLDAQEDNLNSLPTGHLVNKDQLEDFHRRTSVIAETDAEKAAAKSEQAAEQA